MNFIERILAAVAGFLAEPLSYLATKIVTVMYPTASYNEILAHSNSASDTAAGVLAAIIIAWALWRRGRSQHSSSALRLACYGRK
jgi:uncharacterized membrane protein